MSGRALNRLSVIEKHINSVRKNRPQQSSHGTQLARLDACGIIAVVADDSDTQPAVNYLMEGLTILQNRAFPQVGVRMACGAHTDIITRVFSAVHGYDSAGVVTVSDTGAFNVSKFASETTTSDALVKLGQSVPKHTSDRHIGVGHTRWATHGAKTDTNAHPHLDATGRVSVVHNGVIENADKLRDEMAERGFRCVSETDTEVIAQLIGYEVVTNKLPLLEAVRIAQGKLEGSWGVVAVDRMNPREMVAAVHGSPLLIGIAKNKKFIASEATAFSKYTKQYVALEDGEVVSVTVDSELHPERVETADAQEVLLTPHPFPHWTIREIKEQPASIMRALSFGGRIQGDSEARLGGLDSNKAVLLACDHLVIAACGTSWHAGLWGAKMMRSLNCFKTIQVFDAAELDNHDFPRSARTAMLVLSQSGETKDVLMALERAQEMDIPVFSVVNSVGSTIARTTSCGVYLNAGREVAVASTKAFTSQATVLTLVALWFAQNQNASKKRSEFARKAAVEGLHNLSVRVQRTLQMTEDPAKQLAQHLYDTKCNSMFILGKGPCHAIALEGALKIKEISYVQAEGYSGGALKHGPFALIEKGTPIILLILNDHDKHRMLTAAAEVHARGAYTIAIGNSPEARKSGVIDLNIPVPDCGMMTSLLTVIPLQLLAYELSILHGYPVDKPRNLAKAVTVA